MIMNSMYIIYTSNGGRLSGLIEYTPLHDEYPDIKISLQS